jgi:nucleotide-binding universal stress UspA family protein
MTAWIVCGIAQTEGNAHTLKVAARLADRLGARLAMVAVIDSPADSSARRAATAQAASALAALARRWGVVDDAVHRIETGDPAERLAHVADELDAELVVVGGTRRSRLASLLNGDVAERVSRRARRPVAVVPAGHYPAEAVEELATAGEGDPRGQMQGPLAAVRRRLGSRMSGHARRPRIVSAQS